jgi:TatD DNase family protein
MRRSPRFWDAHVHLQAFADPPSQIQAAKARDMGLVSVTVNAREALASLELKDRNPNTVRSFIGVHPSDAAAIQAPLDGLEGLWERCDGVGEIGLDPRYSEASANTAQMTVFTRQLEVASKLAKPVQVHSRGAEAPCLDVLEGFSLRAVLMHWFEGEEVLQRASGRSGTFFSFGPALLYSKKLARVASAIPPEAVLVESDGPVSFRALRGATGPALVPSVVFRLGELWGIDAEEAASRVETNTRRFLGEA